MGGGGGEEAGNLNVPVHMSFSSGFCKILHGIGQFFLIPSPPDVSQPPPPHPCG